MKDGKDAHPCNTCKYFAGWDEITTNERGLSVDIPICGYRIFTLALVKCENYIFKPCPGVDENKPIESIYENPDSPVFVG